MSDAKPTTPSAYVAALERHRSKFAHLDVGKGCIRFRSVAKLPLPESRTLLADAAAEAAGGGTS